MKKQSSELGVKPFHIRGKDRAIAGYWQSPKSGMKVVSINKLDLFDKRDFARFEKWLVKAKACVLHREKKDIPRFAVDRDILSLTGKALDRKTWNSWTPDQRILAVDWASAAHFAASDNPVKVPKVPAHVYRLPDIGLDGDSIWPELP